MPKKSAFEKLYKNVKKSYLGKEVPLKYRKEYGKKYNKKDVEKAAIRIAKSRGIPI